MRFKIQRVDREGFVAIIDTEKNQKVGAFNSIQYQGVAELCCGHLNRLSMGVEADACPKCGNYKMVQFQLCDACLIKQTEEASRMLTETVVQSPQNMTGDVGIMEELVEKKEA